MAQGVEIWAAEMVLELQRDYSIFLECVLPCRDQANRWPYESRRRYRSILERCNQITLLQSSYTADCFHRSKMVIAVWNGTPSGTGSTVAYAKANGKLVHQITP